MSPLLAAEPARLETMVRFFLLAVVLVSPVAVLVARRIRRSRPPEHVDPDEAGPEQDDHPVPTAADADADDDLAALVARIDAVAASPDLADEVAVPLPAPLAARVSGPTGVTSVERLVLDDAIRRGRLRARWEAATDDGDGGVLHLGRAPDGPGAPRGG